MRKHPLLALCTATVILATTGLLEQSAFASGANGHETTTKKSSADLAVRATAKAVDPKIAIAAPGLSASLPLTFAVGGGPALGSYIPPAVRARELAAHRRAVDEHEHALAEAHAAAERRVQARHTAASLAAGRSAHYEPAGGVWAELRACESGGNYAEDTGNGYYGAYQFSLATWWSIGFSGMPNDASPAMQDHAAQVLLQRQGWVAWPVCSVVLGLR